ncbi:hypothetical protein AB0P21_41135 [Kribbella sp. NPDC056861]|uniref:hypothetical protein n=1 Tax=Kribbella sp. NPDC056861 TaxID=3154857 RepID=UPI00341A5CF1
MRIFYYTVGDTSRCTFTTKIDWGDGTTPQNVVVPGSSTDGFTLAATHKNPFKGKQQKFVISVTGSASGGCFWSDGSVEFTYLACDTNHLSGASWEPKFPKSGSMDELAEPFRTNAYAFKNAMRMAGIDVDVISTFRSFQRAYLMQWSYKISRDNLDPATVPAFVPSAGQPSVDICWVHSDANGNPDRTASANAATALAKALVIYGNKTSPSANSRHCYRMAVDWTTVWTAATITVANTTGPPTTITSTPRSGLNPDLIKVGATYGLKHYGPIATDDANHWSDTGS